MKKLTSLIFAVLCFSISKGQDLPSDLYSVTNAPFYWTYFSIANWPVFPPCPMNCWGETNALYYSASWDAIFVDDTLSTYNHFTQNGIDPWEPGDPVDTNAVDNVTSTNWPPPPDPQTDHTNLIIGINYVTNTADGWWADLVIYNTTNTFSYEILSSTNVQAPITNWQSEGVWAGLNTNTPGVRVPWLDRTNQLFFRARVFDGTWANGFPRNGTLVLQLADSNPLVGWINGATNTITPLASNYVILHPPLWEVNLGYDASDFATETNYLRLWPPNKVAAMYGRSDTISNLCLSYSPLTNIDVHGWANLYDLEAWHCTNLLFQNVTQCPRLRRVCFESLEDLLHGLIGTLDFTGSPNIADVRAACNAFTNITFGPGGGSNVFHFCTRASHARNYASPLIDGLPFANLPNLKQLWVWSDYSFEAPINLAYTNCPDFESLQANNNGFLSMNLYGQLHLTNAILYDCPVLTNINIAGCSNLLELHLRNTPLSIEQVDNVLTNLDNMAKSNRIVRINSGASETACPSAPGIAAANHLLSKGWIVQYNDPDTAVASVTNLFTYPGSNDCTITWSTPNVAANSIVYYGTNSANLIVRDDALAASHSVTLTGLQTNTMYKFAVSSTHGTNTGWSTTNTFRTLGRAPNTNRIWFVSTSRYVSMQSAVGSVANISWMWEGGSTNTNTTASIDFGSSATRTNWLIVDPAEALTLFGAECQQSADTELQGAGGFTNYPNIKGLYFYVTHLTDLSLVGMTNLNYVAAVGTLPTTNTANAWFHDVATAQAGISQIGSDAQLCPNDSPQTFYAPAGTFDDNSLADRTSMTNAGWKIVPF